MNSQKKEENGNFRIRLSEELPDHKTIAILDDLDREILELSLTDVFFSFNELAEKWKVTPATIRNRVKRLKTSGVMDVIVVMNPYKIGYTTFAVIGVRVEAGGDFQKIADTLLAIPGVTNVMMVTGRYDFFVHYVCRNTEEYRRFVVDELKKIPGIASVESYIGLDLYERKFELGVIGSV